MDEILNYLKKLKMEYTTKKQELEEKQEALKKLLRKNAEEQTTIEANTDESYELFTPRQVNVEQKVRMRALKEESVQKKQILDNIETELDSCQNKITDIEKIIRQARNIAEKEKRSAESKAEEQQIAATIEEYMEKNQQFLYDLLGKLELCAKLIDLDPVRCKLELSDTMKKIVDSISDDNQTEKNVSRETL